MQDAGRGTTEAPELRQGHEDADEHAPYTAVARQMLTRRSSGASVAPRPSSCIASMVSDRQVSSSMKAAPPASTGPRPTPEGSPQDSRAA